MGVYGTIGDEIGYALLALLCDPGLMPNDSTQRESLYNMSYFFICIISALVRDRMSLQVGVNGNSWPINCPCCSEY